MTFRDDETHDIFEQKRSKAARKRLPLELWGIAQRKFSMLMAAQSLDDLKAPPGNRLHSLSGDRTGQHAICINDKYRICFVFRRGTAEEIEIIDYH